MSHAVVITEAQAKQAGAVLVELLKATDDKGQMTRERAASSIIRLFQAQERYTPEEVAERAKEPKASQTIKDLNKLTQEEVLRLQEEMTKDYPGKPS